MSIIVTRPSLRHGKNQTLVSATIGSVEAWITIDAPWILRQRLRATLYPFAPIALLAAAASGQKIHFDDDIEDGWWLNLMGAFLPLINKLYNFPTVSASRRGSSQRSIQEPGAQGLMFSGGIDSFYSKGLCREVGTAPDWFININAGAHDFDRRCWENRLANAIEVANQEGIGTIIVDTNFHEIVLMDHIRVHIIRNICASLALFPAIDRLIYSSGHEYNEISYDLGRKRGIDHVGHAVVASLIPGAVSLAYLGWNATRVEKTVFVAQDPLAARHLNICTNQEYQSRQADPLPLNCGECDKCVRTMLTLECLGDLDVFGRVFPVSSFRPRAKKLLADLAKSPLPTDREVVELFASRKKSWIKDLQGALSRKNSRIV